MTTRVELRARLRALAAGADPSAANAERLEAEARPVERDELAGPRAEAPEASARTLRVSLETLDRLLDLTGEIAVDRGRLREALDLERAPATRSRRRSTARRIVCTPSCRSW